MDVINFGMERVLRMGIFLGCNCSLEAQYPANTNVLYVDLASVEKIASSQSADSLPGMIMNLKKPTVYLDGDGGKHRLFLKPFWYFLSVNSLFWGFVCNSFGILYNLV